MPFYEYECENCKFYTELLQKVSDAPLRKCPSCGKNAMKKLVSAPVFRLKGAGWYETDFKSDKENKRNLAVDKEPDTVSESKPAKAVSPDAKPADAKADAKPAETSKASESKSSASASASASEGGSSRSTRKSSAPARAAAAPKSRARTPAGRPAAKSKAKPAARRKSR